MNPTFEEVKAVLVPVFNAIVAENAYQGIRGVTGEWVDVEKERERGENLRFGCSGFAFTYNEEPGNPDAVGIVVNVYFDEVDDVFAYTVTDTDGDEIETQETLPHTAFVLPGTFAKGIVATVRETIEGNPDACPGCGCLPGDGKTEGCNDPDGCGFCPDFDETDAPK